MGGARTAGNLFLGLGFACFFLTSAFTHTAAPIVAVFPIAGFFFWFLALIFYIAGRKKDEFSELRRYDVRYEDTERIAEYNHPNHRFYKAIIEVINNTAYNLEVDPDLDLDSQMRSLGIESYANYCPHCNKQLFLFKEFLIFCMNCKLIIAEWKYI